MSFYGTALASNHITIAVGSSLAGMPVMTGEVWCRDWAGTSPPATRIGKPHALDVGQAHESTFLIQHHQHPAF
jgi:hypothetical protein